jgi:NAD(P)-dependent dehydrogenase (short-subunit alcohol dehydrogenase family)
MNESILITGANVGLGKEAARQLALKKETKKIILFCRNQAKAQAAKKDLEEKTGKRIFEIIIGDVSDENSVRKAIEKIIEPIDAIILNAGGIVGKTAGNITSSGMNEIAATNVLGHVILVEELIKHDKLKKAILYVSSEAVRGVKQMGMKPALMKTSSIEEFAAVLDGSYFGDNFDNVQAYGYVKYTATMWMFSMARKHPGLKFVAVSPGNTDGTKAPDNFSLAMKFMLKYIMMPIVLPLLGMVNKIEVGTKRLVDGISDDRFKSGIFYASKEGKMTGEVVDQGTFFTDLKNATFQDNAASAIHRFIKQS